MYTCMYIQSLRQGRAGQLHVQVTCMHGSVFMAQCLYSKCLGTDHDMKTQPLRKLLHIGNLLPPS